MALPHVNVDQLREERYILGEKTLMGLLENCPQNQTIGDNLVRAWSKINSNKYSNILCSISGGSDSDIILDICEKCDKEGKVEYIWFNTGLEYQATKEHLKYLEKKYNITIEEKRAEKPISICCAKYGQPFLSKQVSEYISRLQKHNFEWEDEELDTLLKKYPKCKVALKWWCNAWGDKSKFNIEYNKWLKEFMIMNPPLFDISNKCCHYAKKLVAKHAKEDCDCDLSIVGVRKTEGGARSSAYKNCFSENDRVADEYRPIFWYKNSDKEDYEKHYGIIHSRCYTDYGLKRTGCAGCPYGRDFEKELEIIQEYEPKLFIAVNKIFADSYSYTRKYREFCKMMDKKKKNN